MWKRILATLVLILFLSSCQNTQQNPPTEQVKVTTEPICFTPVDLIPLSFTPDNQILAIRTGSGVQLFNLRTMKEEKFIKSPKPVVAAALSLDGKIVAWSLEDHYIQLIQVSDGKVLKTLTGHTDIVFKLRFSYTGGRLFSGSHDRTVRIWDKSGRLIEVIETNGEVLGIGVSSDGTRLATIPFDGPVELWDLTNNQKLSALGGSGGFDTSDAVFSPDGKYLAADLATGLFLWRLSDGKSLWNEPKNSLAVTFSPDGKYLAYSDVNQKNQIVLSSPDGSQIIRTMEGLQGAVWELFFSPDSALLAGTDGGEIRIWRVEDGTVLYIGKASCP